MEITANVQTDHYRATVFISPTIPHNCTVSFSYNYYITNPENNQISSGSITIAANNIDGSIDILTSGGVLKDIEITGASAPGGYYNFIY